MMHFRFTQLIRNTSTFGFSPGFWLHLPSSTKCNGKTCYPDFQLAVNSLLDACSVAPYKLAAPKWDLRNRPTLKTQSRSGNWCCWPDSSNLHWIFAATEQFQEYLGSFRVMFNTESTDSPSLQNLCKRNISNKYEIERKKWELPWS